MWKKEEGSFKYDNIEFDYRVYIMEGDHGDGYMRPPVPTQVEVDFIGFFPDTNLGEYLDRSIENALVESMLEGRWI